MKNLVILLVLCSLLSCEKSDPDEGLKNHILTNYAVSSIAFDSNGAAWIGTLDQGLIKYSNNETVVFNSSNSDLPNDMIIWDIKIDSKDNIWIACDGLIKYDGSAFTLYNSHNTAMPVDYVNTIAIDSHDNIWFSSCRFQEGGLVMYDGTEWNVYTPENSDLPANSITSIVVDKNDNVWLAVSEIVKESHLVKIEDNTWTVYSNKDFGFTPYFLGNLEVNSENKIYCSVDYILWWLDENYGPQVFTFDGSTCEQFEFDRYTDLRFIRIDKNDDVYCASNIRYRVLRGDTWIFNDNVYEEGGVFAIEESPDNKMWIGTGTGIYIIE